MNPLNRSQRRLACSDLERLPRNQCCTAKNCAEELHPRNTLYCAKHRELAARGIDFAVKAEGPTPCRIGSPGIAGHAR